MGQRPIAIHIKVPRPDAAHDEHVVVGVAEAARRLDVSERTVYRLLKAGILERGSPSCNYDSGGTDDALMSDKPGSINGVRDTGAIVKMSAMSDNTAENGSVERDPRIEHLQRQLDSKDAQIAQLLDVQQELAQTIRRLQEQMYELAHLVLTHNVAAAQAKAEAELKAQQEQAKGRGGLTGLLGSRGRR